MKRAVLIILAVSFAVALSSAQTVGVAVIEIDGTRGAISPYTEQVLGGCLDALFASGFIATNPVPVEGDEPDSGDPAFGIREARNGMADFVLVLALRYGWSTAEPTKELPRVCRWRVVRASDGVVLSAGESDGPADSRETINASLKAMTDYGYRIVESALPSMELPGEPSPGKRP
ncbi:MAG: hypothetical protein NT080_13555 [Spirochaetes bacterium]|nr:hypothetical protein [Spirochaetota bacterium]